MSTNKDKELPVPLPQKFNDLQSFANSLSDVYIDKPKKCKLCQSPHMAEANEMYEKGRPATQVFKWLVDTHKFDGSYVGVNNHLTNHRNLEKDNLNLKEYATQLSKWNELSSDSESLLNRYIRMFDREATLLLSKNNELPTFEVRKNIETALKVAATIGYYKEQLQKLQAEKRPVELVIISLTNIIGNKLENTSSPEVKRVLQDVIDQLSREVGDFSVDGDTVEN